MIEDKTIFFGYGTVGVTNSLYSLVFTSIKPPQKIGREVNLEALEIGKRIILSFDGIEVFEFSHELDRVTSGRQINFKGITLDFSKYNEDSVSTVKAHIARVRKNILLPYAC